MLLTQSSIIQVLDAIAAGATLARAAAEVGGREKLISGWLRRSRAAPTDPALSTEWPDGFSPKPFHEAVGIARRQYALDRLTADDLDAAADATATRGQHAATEVRPVWNGREMVLPDIVIERDHGSEISEPSSQPSVGTTSAEFRICPPTPTKAERLAHLQARLGIGANAPDRMLAPPGPSPAPRRIGEPMAPPQSPTRVGELTPDQIKTLAHLDTLPDTPMNRDFRERTLRGVAQPQPKLPTPAKGVPSDEPPSHIPAMQRPPAPPRAPVPAIPTLVKGERDHVGRGAVFPGGFKVS